MKTLLKERKVGTMVNNLFSEVLQQGSRGPAASGPWKSYGTLVKFYLRAQLIRRIREGVIYRYCYGRTLENLHGAFGNSHGESPGPLTENEYREPWASLCRARVMWKELLWNLSIMREVRDQTFQPSLQQGVMAPNGISVPIRPLLPPDWVIKNTRSLTNFNPSSIS